MAFLAFPRGSAVAAPSARFARRILPVVSQPGFSARHAENDSLPVQRYLRGTTHRQIGFSAPLYVDDSVEESELVERQTGAPLGERTRLAARVAASPIALSPNGCKGKKYRIARRGKPR